jgi:imidazolonepropionase-like amidohydrolase
MLQNAIKLGVKIALGTDQFPYEPNGGTTATIAEAELYQKAGMTPLEALQAATIKPADMLKIEADSGRIQPGKYADIVAVTADPVKDISALRTLDFVMKGGNIVRDDDDPLLRVNPLDLAMTTSDPDYDSSPFMKAE